MTDTLVLVWSGKNFISSSSTSTTSTYHLIGTNMTVDWGDGTTGTITKNQRFTHTYSNSGTYTIVITGDTITQIGRYCFRACTGLENIIIPPSVTTLAVYCFNGCTGLKNITFTRNTPPSAGTTSYTNVPSTCKIYVPNSSYKSASNYPSSSTYTYIEKDTTEMAKAAIIAKGIFNKLYPIGAIYMTTESINPSEKFGGAWEQIKDRFLLGCGSMYTNGSTGGESTHVLTINEMPPHTHSRTTAPQGFAERDNSKDSIICINANEAAKIVTKYNNNTGGGAAHNNMPPYLTVYIWRRLA